MVSIKRLITVTSSLLLLAGCQEDPVYHSGFMDSYAEFETREWSDGAQVHLKPGTDLDNLGKYKKFMLIEPEIWHGKEVSYAGINTTDLKYVTDQFMHKFKAAFEPDYPVVDKTGADVLILRSAITGIDRKYPERSGLGYTPTGLIVEAGENVSASGHADEIIVYKASLEVELIDSVSGERVAAMVDSRESDSQSVAEGKKDIKMVDEVLDYWIKRLNKASIRLTAGSVPSMTGTKTKTA